MFFKKKVKSVPVTTNELCIKITEDVMKDKASELIALHWAKVNTIFKKNKVIKEKKFKALHKEFSASVFNRFPWVTSYTVHERNLRNNQSEYYIKVLKLDYEELSELKLEDI